MSELVKTLMGIGVRGGAGSSPPPVFGGGAAAPSIWGFGKIWARFKILFGNFVIDVYLKLALRPCRAGVMSRRIEKS